jgi:hypothetical protein
MMPFSLRQRIILVLPRFQGYCIFFSPSGPPYTLAFSSHLSTMLPCKSGSQNFEVTNKRDRHNYECHSETVSVLIDGYSTEVARSSDGLFYCPSPCLYSIQSRTAFLKHYERHNPKPDLAKRAIESDVTSSHPQKKSRLTARTCKCNTLSPYVYLLTVSFSSFW